MKKIILTVVIITIIGFFSGLIPECFAAGSQPAPGDDCCVVINPGNGALALKGTISLEYTYWVVEDANPEQSNADCTEEYLPYDCCNGVGTGTCDDPGLKSNLDVLLRLSKGQGGDPEFFRLNLLDEDFRLLTDPSILCLILNPWETEIEENRPLVAKFVNQVLKAFYGDDTELNADNTRLVITSNSISDGQGVFACDDPAVQDRDTKLCEVPGSDPPRVFSMATVDVYIVSLDNIKWPQNSEAVCSYQQSLY